MEKTKKEDIEKAKVEGVCDILTSTNHTLLRGPDIVKILGLIGGNEDVKNVLNGTWVFRTNLKKNTKDILLCMNKYPKHLILGDIKVDITKDSFVYHQKRSRGISRYSISGLYSSHYKSAASSAILSEIYAIFVISVLPRAFYKSRW